MRIPSLLFMLSLALGSLAIPIESPAQVAVGISVRIGPPVLPVYVQPPCPEDGFIWIPGYWAWGPDGYFWVPGTWVEPPEVDLLWTPGYWAFEDGVYVWYPGYWGPEVGFYGGINYGFGYTGVGFFGGYWTGGRYYYNRAVTNVNTTIIHNVYNTKVVNNNVTVNRVSFNGGNGGTTARPSPQQMAAGRQHHVPLTAEQAQHQQAASQNRTLLASVNHGRPDVAATPRPGAFEKRGAMQAPTNRNNPRENVQPSNPARGGNLAQGERRVGPASSMNAPENVNTKQQQKQQQEMDRLRQKQDAERQKMEPRQAQEQERMNRQNANQQRQEEIGRRQQPQTEQMNQRHEQQTQRIEPRQQRETQQQPRERAPERKQNPDENR